METGGKRWCDYRLDWANSSRHSGSAPCYSLKKVSIPNELQSIVEQHQTLSFDNARLLMERVLAGDTSDLELTALVGAMAARGEAAEEIAGFAWAMRAAGTTLPLTSAERDGLVDTCGTGGDGSGTFNISTAAALVAAAAGAKVAKHGNRAVTSRCGSADVLEALGIPISLSPEAAAGALRTHGFCFLLATAHHPGMRAVMPVRRALGVRTIFNVLGPLLNPAGARRQVMGVYSAHLVPLVAQAMTSLEIKHAFVVHGEGGLDELSLAGRSEIAEVRLRSSGHSVSQYTLAPEDLCLSRAPLSALAGGADARENAAILGRIFGVDGQSPETGPHHDVVVLNAAAVLVTAGLATDLTAGVALAAETVSSGAVAKLIDTLRPK